MMPLKYGQNFYSPTEYLVHVMINSDDGSVTLVHGGIELGQGINTKVTQRTALSIICIISMCCRYAQRSCIK